MCKKFNVFLCIVLSLFFSVSCGRSSTVASITDVSGGDGIKASIVADAEMSSEYPVFSSTLGRNSENIVEVAYTPSSDIKGTVQVIKETDEFGFETGNVYVVIDQQGGSYQYEEDEPASAYARFVIDPKSEIIQYAFYLENGERVEFPRNRKNSAIARAGGSTAIHTSYFTDVQDSSYTIVLPHYGDEPATISNYAEGKYAYIRARGNSYYNFITYLMAKGSVDYKYVAQDNIGITTFDTVCTIRINVDRKQFSDALKEVGSVIYLNDSLSGFEIKEGTTEITSFKNVVAIENLSLPSSVQKIEPEAFASSGIKNINLPEGLKVIETSVFYNTPIESIELPSTITAIGPEAFANCTSLKTLKLPEGVEKIYSEAFANCTSLSSINIPQSVKEIEEEAFLNCTSLTTLKLPNEISLEEEVFSGCTFNLEFSGSRETRNSWDEDWNSGFAGKINGRSFSSTGLL